LSQPSIAIITVVYNGENVIEKTLQNICNQSYSHIEYIVVDGKSTDNTKAVIEKYLPQIKTFICEKDGGIYDAMNKGLNAAQSDYLLFINAGDELNSLHTIQEVFKENSLADIIYSDTMMINENGLSLGLLSQHTHNNAPNNLTWQMMGKGMVVCHQSFIVKRKIAPNYNTNYKYVADIDWVINCLKNSKSTFKTKSIISKFMTGGFSKQKIKQSLKERYRVLLSHFGFLSNLYNHLFIALRALFAKYN
jgi:glycosyltransferase involved in cell wall biosynthesis